VFALGLALLCFLPAPGTLIAAGIACGAGHGSFFPVMNALTVTRTPFHLQGLAVSLYTAALDLGQTLGTPIGGAIARAAGYRAMFAVMAAASVGGLVLMIRDRRRVAAVGLLPLVAGLVLARPAAADWPALTSGPLADDSQHAFTREAHVERGW
jgi:MFS family permease